MLLRLDVASHRVCLARACLPIGKDSGVEAIEGCLNSWLDAAGVDILLATVSVIHCVEGEGLDAFRHFASLSEDDWLILQRDVDQLVLVLGCDAVGELATFDLPWEWGSHPDAYSHLVGEVLLFLSFGWKSFYHLLLLFVLIS